MLESAFSCKLRAYSVALYCRLHVESLLGSTIVHMLSAFWIEQYLQAKNLLVNTVGNRLRAGEVALSRLHFETAGTG